MKKIMGVLGALILVVGGINAYSRASVDSKLNIGISDSADALFAFKEPVITEVSIVKNIKNIYDWRIVENYSIESDTDKSDTSKSQNKSVDYERYLKRTDTSYEIEDVDSGLSLLNNSRNDADSVRIKTIGGKIDFENPSRGIKSKESAKIKAFTKQKAKTFVKDQESGSNHEIKFVVNIETDGAKAELNGKANLKISVKEKIENVYKEKPDTEQENEETGIKASK